MTRAIAVVLLSLGSACTVENPAHCGNNAGDRTCSERGGSTPYCDVCIADNDGCVAELPPMMCQAEDGSTTDVAGTAEDTGVTTSPVTTMASTMAASSEGTSASLDSTGEPSGTTDSGLDSTGSGESSASGDGSSSDGSSGDSSSGDSSSSDGSASSGSTTMTDVGESTDGSTSDTDASSSGGSESSSGGPVCGDGIIEGDEQCDGTNLGGNTCPAGEVGPPACTAECTIDLGPCCVPAGGDCLVLGDCCPGTSCQLLSCG